MDAICDKREFWDRLVLLLASRPRAGWEDLYEEIGRREVERMSPSAQAAEVLKKGPPPTKETAHDPKGSALGSIPD